MPDLKPIETHEEFKRVLSRMTEKRRRFILGWDGSPAYKVARRAGYKSQAAAWALIKDKNISRCLDYVERQHARSVAIQPSRVLQFWSKVTEDEDERMRHRLRASENLGKFYSLLKPDVAVQQNTQNNVTVVIGNSTTADPALPDEERHEIERLKQATGFIDLKPAEPAPKPIEVKTKPIAYHDAEKAAELDAKLAEII